MSESLEDLVTRVLAAAKDVSKGSADVIVDARQHRSSNTRLARNEITTAGDSDETTVTAYIALGKRHASASTNQTDAKSVRALLERAVTMARLSPEDPERMPLLPPATYAAAAPAYDEAVTSLGAAGRAALAGKAIALADQAKLSLAGFLSRNVELSALGTSNGVRAQHRETEASLTVTARTNDGKGSGWAGREVHRMADLDAEDLARVAIDKAVRSAAAKPLDPGKYTVVLEPAAVSELMVFLVSSMDARRADEGRSYFAKKLGEKVFSDLVSLKSDPTDALTPGATFDWEGLPLRPLQWIDRGKVEGLQVSRYWASKQGNERAATGSHRVHHLAGGAAESTDELVRGVKRGLLVTRFWYNRMLDAQTVLVTGLTRDGVFLIEDGKVTLPVSNFRYNESPVTMLKNVDALTRATVRVPSYGGIWRVPALRTHDFTMASTSAAV